MIRLALLLLLLAAPAAPASQALPQVQTLRKTVTLDGDGTRTYWATDTPTPVPQTILKVHDAQGNVTLYFLPDSFHPNDFFRLNIDTPVVVTGSVTVRNGKNYLYPYSAYEKRP